MWLFASILTEPGPPPGAHAVRGPLDEAMDAYAAGDDAAFRTVYQGLLPRVRAFLARLSGDVATAEDLAQETLLRVHGARGSFAEGGSAVTWAMAIARNAYIDHVRRARSRPRSLRGSLDAEADGRDLVAEGTRPDDAAVARQSLAIVQKTLDALPVLQREAFILLRFEGLSVAEAAEVQGAGVAAVKVRAFRAYEALREALGVQGGGVT